MSLSHEDQTKDLSMLLTKYRHMQSRGDSLDALYNAAKTEGLDGYTIFALLRELVGMSWEEVRFRLDRDKVEILKFRERPSWAPIKNQPAFKTLFNTVLEILARFLERSGRVIPRTYGIKVAGTSRFSGQIVDPDTAL